MHAFECGDLDQIDLFVAGSENELQKQPNQLGNQMTSKRLNVLMIEDSSFDSMWIQKELLDSRLNLDVTRVSSITEAKHAQASFSESFDLVLLDLNLPDSSGLESLRKALNINGNTPIVVLTGEEDDDIAYNAASLGAQDYLVKSNKIGPTLRKAIHFVISRQRVTDKLRRNIDVLSIANKLDPLTGLFNRRHMDEVLETLWSDFAFKDEEFSVILVDLDRFGLLNNDHGHAAGDDALRSVSVSLLSRARKCDTVCRYGGEEFCILLPKTSERDAYRLAEKIRSYVEQEQVKTGSEALNVTASFGVASSRTDMETAGDVVGAADAALYAAKARGRNSVATATEQAPLASL